MKPVYTPNTSYMVQWQPKRSLWSRLRAFLGRW